MIKKHKENYSSHWIMKFQGNPSQGGLCFNLGLFIGWSINRYFIWSGSGALVETNVEEVTVNRST